MTQGDWLTVGAVALAVTPYTAAVAWLSWKAVTHFRSGERTR